MAEDSESPERLTRTASVWVLAGLGIFFAVCFSWVGYDYIAYQHRIHSGISIAGVDVGGMTEAEAVAVLSAAPWTRPGCRNCSPVWAGRSTVILSMPDWWHGTGRWR